MFGETLNAPANKIPKNMRSNPRLSTKPDFSSVMSYDAGGGDDVLALAGERQKLARC